MGRKSPAGACSLVDGMADDRMTEAEATRGVSGANQVALDELVESRPGVSFSNPGGLRGKLRLEWIAEHSGALEHGLRLQGKAIDLATNGGADRRRTPPFGRRDLAAR